MLPHFFQSHDKDIIDMDTQERTRYISESSMSGTSGYSTTTSPDPRNSPSSSNYSPAHSPATILQAEFSNLALPPAQNNSYQQQQIYPSQYLQLQNVAINHTAPGYNSDNNNMAVNYSFGTATVAPINFQQPTTAGGASSSYMPVKREYPATLRIVEQPVEKFRFRYKSEMHGTHGSLNGANSQRSTKTFPEIELCDYDQPAIIRCSLFQANRDSPHSHQLVIREDDHDICDPHELNVSPDKGFYVEFKNMGIIHTAKKFIVEELLKKKRKRLQFELGRDNLTTREQQELSIQTEREAKDMNLNQVRLCFEAFSVDSTNGRYTPIAAPVYSNTINNRKSAQTGELKITRLSIATGSATGGEDLILLVEKVNKKNIKVRFFEMNEDDLVWEAFASFRESDVHHQYAIVCRTPAYANKDIDKPVEVFIQLVRPSDDERSEPPVLFRYKPRDAVTSRKRRRTCSSISGSSSSGGSNSGSLSSGELPRTIQEQQQQFLSKFLSEEIERLINNEELRRKCKDLSNEDLVGGGVGAGTTEKDGAATNTSDSSKSLLHYKKLMISKKLMDTAKQQQEQQKLAAAATSSSSSYIQQIVKIYLNARGKGSSLDPNERQQAADSINKLYSDYSDLNPNGDSLIHEMVATDNSKYAIHLCHILQHFQLHSLLNTIVNNKNQTALHTVCLCNHPHYIRPLLSLGCNPNVQDKNGDTAMHIAVREKHTACLDSFLISKKELKLKLRNDDGFTPLHLAVRDNNCELVSKLIKYDASLALIPNSIDGNNALHISIQQQNLELVKIMLDGNNHTQGGGGGVESLLHSRNTAGLTPVDVARQLATTTKQAGEILSLLQVHCQQSTTTTTTKSSADNSPADSCSNLIIKEEEPSSHSSTDNDDDDGDDDEDSNSYMDRPMPPMVTLPGPLDANKTNNRNPNKLNDDGECAMDVQIKIEKQEDDAAEYFTTSQLTTALEDPHIFSQLSKVLSGNDLWKRKLPIPTFYLSQPDMMLDYVRRNIESINVQQFAQTLQEIDSNLLGLIKK
ncbi:nuclear factor NF-kappa-B p110 subunit [Musca vetustissima]|uniref:nuclear factor NF-kappa-B p110 subunit n=1 Tax=Musca vetustissima TaxID=27455 RepID=UPI002AB6355A|nr:nuclear factor NF-kappa-B p110 subunit [Musca vetustissima]